MLMASIHVQMTVVRYRDDINIASLFPAPTPITYSPLVCAFSLLFFFYAPLLSEKKVMNLLEYKGVPEVFSFYILVKIWFNMTKLLCFIHSVQCLPAMPFALSRLYLRTSKFA